MNVPGDVPGDLPGDLPAAAVGQPYGIVIMAASAGGIHAVQAILAGLTADFPAPIVIVLHHGEGRTEAIVRVLARHTSLRVAEATDGDAITAGSAYVAPPDRHLRIQQDLSISSGDGGRINFLRSSAEPLLASVAHVFGRRTIVVVLSGTGRNGVVGTKHLHDLGATVLAQNEASSQHFGMARAAIAANAVTEVLPLDAMAPRLRDLVRANADAGVQGHGA